MVNGYYPVIEALARGLDIRLNQRFVSLMYLKLLECTLAMVIMFGEQNTSKNIIALNKHLKSSFCMSERNDPSSIFTPLVIPLLLHPMTNKVAYCT